MEGVPIKDTMLSEICPDIEAAFCFPQKYRTPNGECNNVKNPMWGVTGAAYLRLSPPTYDDGIGTPRWTSVPTGNHLPDAKTVSNRLAYISPNDPHEHMTALGAIWAQFVAHDISYTLPIHGYENCCDKDFREKHAMECLPIVEGGNSQCQEYVRSAVGLKPGCSLGPREQMNFATAFLDGSALYGSTPKSAEDLRSLEGGRLKTDRYGFLPRDDHNPNCRTDDGIGTVCFRSGDERVNSNAGLAVLHTLLAREHNRIAKNLEAVNPHWDEETLYQESRRIVGAEIQHITYNEFLPIVLGEKLMETFELNSKSNGYFMNYDDELPVSTLNSVGNAILPMVMSLLPPKLYDFAPVSLRYP